MIELNKYEHKLLTTVQNVPISPNKIYIIEISKSYQIFYQFMINVLVMNKSPIDIKKDIFIFVCLTSVTGRQVGAGW